MAFDPILAAGALAAAVTDGFGFKYLSGSPGGSNRPHRRLAGSIVLEKLYDLHQTQKT